MIDSNLHARISNAIYQTPEGADWIATCDDAASRVIDLLNAEFFRASAHDDPSVALSALLDVEICTTLDAAKEIAHKGITLIRSHSKDAPRGNGEDVSDCWQCGGSGVEEARDERGRFVKWDEIEVDAVRAAAGDS